MIGLYLFNTKEEEILWEEHFAAGAKRSKREKDDL